MVKTCLSRAGPGSPSRHVGILESVVLSRVDSGIVLKLGG